jgi:hypothetical protein
MACCGDIDVCMYSNSIDLLGLLSSEGLPRSLSTQHKKDPCPTATPSTRFEGGNDTDRSRQAVPDGSRRAAIVSGIDAGTGLNAWGQGTPFEGDDSPVRGLQGVPDGSRRAAFVCFVASPSGVWKTDGFAVRPLLVPRRVLSFYSLARSFPVCRPCRPSRLFLGVGTSVSRGLGKGYDSDSFQQRFRGRVRLGPALPDFRF